MHLPLCLRQWLCDLAGMLDEQVGDWTEPAVLQSDDADWDGRHWQGDWQGHDVRLLGGKPQRGSWKDSDETAGRYQAHTGIGRYSDNGRAREVDAIGTKA